MYMFEPETQASSSTQQNDLKSDITAVLESFCVCGICESRCNLPKTLDCLHSFCSECIRRISSNDLVCPICKVSFRSLNQSVEVSELLENLKPSILFDGRLRQFQENKQIPCRDHPEYKCNFYFKDFSGLACEKCLESGVDVCSELSDHIATQIKYHQRKLLQDISCETEKRLVSIQDSLNSHGNQMRANFEETIAGITEYFSDLKKKVMSYLTVQEKNVIDHLKQLTEKETTTILENEKLCLSLSNSLKQKYSHLSRSLESDSEKNNVPSILAMDIFKHHANEYVSKANSLGPSMENETEFRFIINTELEDMLSESSLIEIESLNSQTRNRPIHSNNQSQPRSVEQTVNNPSEEDERRACMACAETANVSEISRGPSNVSHSMPKEQLAQNLSGQENHAEPEVPPPPYPGPPISHPLRGILRRRSFRSAPVHSNTGTTSTLASNVIRHTNEQTNSAPTYYHYSSTEADGPLFDLKNNSHTFSIAYQSDHTSPEIAEVEWLTPTALVVLDKKNKSLKIVGDDGTLLSCHVLEHQAYNFTLVDDEIDGMLSIVATHSGKLIKYCIEVRPMSSNNYLKTVRFKPEVIRTRDFYRCVTFYAKRRKFVALSATSVDILNETGRVEYSVAELRKIRFYAADFRYPSSVFSIRVNNHGIIALSNKMHVIFITMDGVQTGVFHGDNMTINGLGMFEPKNLFYVALSSEHRGQLACVDSQGKRLYVMNFKRRSDASPMVLSFSPHADVKLAVGHGNGKMSVHSLMIPRTTETRI